MSHDHPDNQRRSRAAVCSVGGIVHGYVRTPIGCPEVEQAGRCAGKRLDRVDAAEVAVDPTIVDARDLPVSKHEEFYDTVLAPSFVESELIPRAELLADLNDPRGESFASLALDDTGEIIGGAVGQWFPHCRVMLTAYLAIRPGQRGGGIGGKILRAVIADWQTRVDPLLIVGEVEDPRHHIDTGFGDPERRVKFYAAAGAKIVPVPYFQPAIHADGERVPHLFLMTFAVHDTCRRGEHSIDAGPVRAFLVANLAANEGRVDPDDPATAALLEAVSAPTVELVDPHRYPDDR